MKEKKTFKVAKKTPPKSLGGKIANTLNNDTTVELRSINPAATWQAMKAQAVARGFMADKGYDLMCSCSFITPPPLVKQDDGTMEPRPGVKLLNWIEKSIESDDRRQQVMRVSAKTAPDKLASSIVHVLKEGKDVVLKIIGAPACWNSAKALSIARGFLEDKPDGLIYIPGFITPTPVIAGVERTGLKLTVRLLDQEE